MLNAPARQSTGDVLRSATAARAPSPAKAWRPPGAHELHNARAHAGAVASRGQPLESGLRLDMERRFGADFASVRLHTDAPAGAAASRVGALAYTVGSDIVFSRGAYTPRSAQGRYLLAHELGHVVQDPGARGASAPAALEVGPQGDAAERAADRAAREVVTGGSPRLRAQPSRGRLRRACPPAPTGLGATASESTCGTAGPEPVGGDILLFCRDSDQLSDGQDRSLATLAAQARTASRVVIHGYASQEGPSTEYNQNLACKRTAAAARLLGAGTPELVTHGPTSAFGPAEANRNVVVVITPAVAPAPVAPTVTPRAQAIALADEDCRAITALRTRYAGSARGLFLEIYSCLTCSFAGAFRAGSFEDPLWLARVNHDTFARLQAAFTSPDAGYRSAFAPCDLFDQCVLPPTGAWWEAGLTALGCSSVMQGTGPLALLQSCTEGVGTRHLLVDLAAALRTLGCASAANTRDYARVVPFFEACNRRDPRDPVPGDRVAGRGPVGDPHDHEPAQRGLAHRGLPVTDPNPDCLHADMPFRRTAAQPERALAHRRTAALQYESPRTRKERPVRPSGSRNRAAAAPYAPDMRPHEAPRFALGLLRGFELRRDDRTIALSPSTQRVLAFLALHDRPVRRLHVAGTLWLEASEARANGCLRTALWRLGLPGSELVRATATHVALHPDVVVDVHETQELAEYVLQRGYDAQRGAVRALCRSGELLPDWYDEWLTLPRERFRQLRLHALEALCGSLAADHRFAEATEAGLAAIESEPLRESAHRALIGAYLAEGNPGEAVRQYQRFRAVLRRELGLEPSRLLKDLMGGLPAPAT